MDYNLHPSTYNHLPNEQFKHSMFETQDHFQIKPKLFVKNMIFIDESQFAHPAMRFGVCKL